MFIDRMNFECVEEISKGASGQVSACPAGGRIFSPVIYLTFRRICLQRKNCDIIYIC